MLLLLAVVPWVACMTPWMMQQRQQQPLLQQRLAMCHMRCAEQAVRAHTALVAALLDHRPHLPLAEAWRRLCAPLWRDSSTNTTISSTSTTTSSSSSSSSKKKRCSCLVYHQAG